MVEVHQALVEATEEALAGLCNLVDTYVAVQRRTLTQFPASSRAAAVALGAQLDQLEAMARDGVQVPH